MKLTPAKVRRTIESRWGAAAPSTWNSRMTALQSFVRYCDRNSWIKRDPLKGIERKPRDETKAITGRPMTVAEAEAWYVTDRATRTKTE